MAVIPFSSESLKQEILEQERERRRRYKTDDYASGFTRKKCR